MKLVKHSAKALIYLILFMLVISKSYATVIFLSPNFGPDDGSGLFMPLFDTAFTVEIFDAQGVMDPNDGFEFGFYFDKIQ